MHNKFEFINPPELGKHPGYSNGIKTPSASLLFVAGQVAWDEANKIVSSEFVGQFDQALSNVLTVVRQAGGVPEDIVRLTIYVLDRREYLENLKLLGEAYRRQMGKHYAAMTLVEVRGFMEEGAKVELEATAVL